MQEVIPPTPEPDSTPNERPKRRMSTGLIVALSGVVLGLLMLCGVGTTLICQTIDGGCNLPSLGDNSPTPTPLVEGIPTLEFNPPVVEVALGDQSVALDLDAPTQLAAAGEDFAIQVGAVATDGRWNPTVGSEKVAVWLNGTVINYVVAVQDTEANRAVMQSLELGDVMTMSTQQGRALEFDFSSREVVPVTRVDVFGQTSPGITIVLARDDDAQERMIVRGRYRVGEAAQSISPGGTAGFDGGRVANIGEIVQLGDIQLLVTAFDSRAVTDGNFTYFLVDYQIRNDGSVPVQAGVLEMTLVDTLGTIYPLSLDASQIGNFPPIPQSLSVGQPLQATAGYQVRNGLDASSLGWVVRRLDTGEEVEIRAAGAAAGDSGAEVASAEIVLDSASLVADATSLLLQGAIANTGATTLVITQDDVSLDAGGTVYLIQSTNPSFPWTVAPGETISYAITVQKPIVDSVATFSILNSSWQLDNFR